MSDEGWSPIVVPLDGTELAEAGLDLSIGLAARLGAFQCNTWRRSRLLTKK